METRHITIFERNRVQLFLQYNSNSSDYVNKQQKEEWRAKTALYPTMRPGFAPFTFTLFILLFLLLDWLDDHDYSNYGLRKGKESIVRQLAVDNDNDNEASWICSIVQNSVYYWNVFGVSSDDEWECIARELNRSYIIKQLPPDFLKRYSLELAKGQLEVEIQKATLHSKNSTLVVSEDTTIKILGRRLQLQQQSFKAVGRKQVLALSISTADSKSTKTAAELHPFLFAKDRVSVVTQFEECSAGKLQLQPIFGGVIDVQLTGKSGDYEGVLEAVHESMDILEEQLGVDNIEDFVDHLLFCLPPGMAQFTASAVTNHYRSVYNDSNCARLSIVMHEIG
jgi:hypothetical protein